MKQKEAQALPLGVYHIYWKKGGSSLASVGRTHSGKAWFAPCNWTGKDDDYIFVAVTEWGAAANWSNYASS